MIAHTWQVCTSVNCVIDWMYYWQTMLTGVGAVSAAAVSIRYLQKQILITEALEERRRTRRLAAARARLPLALSGASNYAESVLGQLKECLDHLQASGEIPKIVTAIGENVPEQAILSFEALIEATDDDQFAALIANMIAEIQVLDSRLGDLDDQHGKSGVRNVHTYILNAAKIYGYASSIYDYARRETEHPPHALDWESVVSALFLNHLHEAQYPELHAFIHRAEERAEIPGQ